MSRFERVFLVLVAARSVTIVLEGSPAGALILVGVVAATRGRWSVLAFTAFAVNAMMGGSNSLLLMGSVALAVAWFDGDDLTTVLRSQAVIVYAFAATNKLWPNFLSGHVIHNVTPWMPHPELAAPAVVFTEMLLAVAVLRRWSLALPLAVAAHIGFVIGTADNLLGAVSLATFNGVMVLVVWQLRADAGTPERRGHVASSTRAANL